MYICLYMFGSWFDKTRTRCDFLTHVARCDLFVCLFLSRGLGASVFVFLEISCNSAC